MDKRTQAQIILEELNEQYSIPTYMEEYAIKGILAGLTRIELAGLARIELEGEKEMKLS